tara:strand:+ start:436 stop:825 length:390 start_codon:yes stop_codon:yes gene_type:complete
VKRKSFRAVVEEPYKIRILNRESFDKFLNEFDEGVILEIEVKEIVNRTQVQNSYYWGQVIGSPSKEGSLLSNEMFQGYTKQELHEALKEKFEVKSTIGMSQEDFTEYINKIIRWAAEFADMYIKEPEDV